MNSLSTIREILSSIKKGVKEVHADSRLTNKYVYTVLKGWIKSILSRDSDAFRLTNRASIYQVLKCVPVIEAPAIDPCCGLRTRCKVWRTRDRLPDMIEDSIGPKITLVAPVDGLVKMSGSNSSLTVVLAKDIRRRLDNPWSKNNKEGYAVYNDGYLYFPDREWRMVVVEAIFLEEVVSPCEGGEGCKKYLDKKLFIPERQLQEAMNKTIEQIVNVYKRSREQQLIDKNENT